MLLENRVSGGLPVPNIVVFETVIFYPLDTQYQIHEVPDWRSNLIQKYEMLFQKGFQLIVLFVHWLDKNKTQIETQHQSKKSCCKNETCLLRAIMATSTIALPQGRMKWSNCRLTTKNPDYQLGNGPFWLSVDRKTFQGCVIFCAFCAGQKPQERNALKSI